MAPGVTGVPLLLSGYPVPLTDRLLRVLMEGVVLHNNDKMLMLMRRLGFEIRPEAEEPSLRQVVKRLA